MNKSTYILLVALATSPLALAADAVDPLQHPVVLIGQLPAGPSWAEGSIVEDADGNLYVTADEVNVVYRKPPGGVFAAYATLPEWACLGLAHLDSTLYVGTAYNHRIYSLDTDLPSPTPVFVADVPGTPYSLSVSGSPRELYVGTDNGAYSVNLDTGTATLVAGGVGVDLNSVCYDHMAGEALISDYWGSRVLSVTPGGVSVFAVFGGRPETVLHHPATADAYVVLPDSGEALQIDHITGAQTTIVTGWWQLGGAAPTGLAFSWDGTRLYFLDRTGGRVDVLAFEGFPAVTGGVPVHPQDGDRAVGHVAITVELQDAEGDDVVVSFEYSVNGGSSFAPCTAAPTSLLTNPTQPQPTPSLASYIWDSLNDGVGLSAAAPVELLITVSDGAHATSSTVSLTVDNSSCSIPLLTVPGYTARSLGRYDIGSNHCRGGIAEDLDGNVYVTSSTLDPVQVYRRAPGASFAPFVTIPGEYGYGLTVRGSDLYVAANDKKIYRVELLAPGHPPIATVMTTLDRNANQMAASRFSPTLIAGTNGDGVHEISLPGGASSLIFGDDSTRKVSAYSQDESSVLSADYSTRVIYEHSLATGMTQPLGSTLPESPDSIAVHPVTGDVFITLASSSCGGDSIVRWDAQGGSQITFASGLNFGNGSDSSPLAFSRDGRRLYFATAIGGDLAEAFVVEGFPTMITGDVTSLTQGQELGGNVEIVFDVDHNDWLPVVVTFEYSVDDGATFLPCTTAGCSTLANPSSPLGTPALSASYIWDSLNDLGFIAPAPVELRMTMADGTIDSTAQVGVIVDNTTYAVFQTPVCGATEQGLVSIAFAADDLEGDDLVALIEFSTDGGATYQPCSVGASSPLTNPTPALSVPVLGQNIVWNPVSDGLTPESTTPVDLKITVIDLAGDRGTNGLLLDVELGPDCRGRCGDCDESFRVDILDALRAAQFSVGAGTLSQTGQQLCNVANPGEGIVSVLDALTIARFVVGRGPGLYCCP